MYAKKTPENYFPAKIFYKIFKSFLFFGIMLQHDFYLKSVMYLIFPFNSK